MEKLSTRTTIALLLTSAAIFATGPTLAQERERQGPVISKEQSAPDRSSSPDRASPQGKSVDRAPSEPRGETKSERRADDAGQKPDRPSDRKAAPNEKSARSDDKQSDDKQQERVRSKQSAGDKSGKDSRGDAGREQAKRNQNERDRAAEQPAKAPDRTAKDQDAEKSRAGSRADAKDEAKHEATGDRAKPDKVRSADLSGDKRERVTKTFRDERNVKHITNVNVEISLGRRLPRDWDYYPVPTAIIDVVPEYRGYRYAYVEDEYVIVDPDTYEVVYVIESSGSGRIARGSSGAGHACTSELALSADDRSFVIERVRSHRSSASIRVGDLSIGFRLPDTVEVETFPSEVTSRVSRLEGCRYLVVEDRVAIVDPEDDEIVTILE